MRLPILARAKWLWSREGQVEWEEWMVAKQLLEKNFCVRILTRNATKAQETLGDNRVEIAVGQLGDGISVAKAFQGPTPISHVVFTAGGDDADFELVNNIGVAECARELQASSAPKKSMVVVSSAWVSKPYSFASVVFNSLFDKYPMAKHYQGEDALRKVAAEAENFHYVILRACRLLPDEEYPAEAASQGLLYQQGDSFFLWGPAGNPGMSNSQLVGAVLTAMQVGRKVTVEVTGAGTADVHDTSVFAEFQEDNPLLIAPYDDVVRCHADAISLLKVCGIVYLVLLGFGILLGRSVLKALLLIVVSFLAFCATWTKVVGGISVLDCVNGSKGHSEL